MAGAGFTLYEDEFYGETEKAEATRSFVVFSLGDEFYGVEMEQVLEVVSIPTIALLPNLPDQILGIFNLRGNIVSITDLRKIFGLLASGEAAEEEETTKSRIVVIELDGVSTGLWADSADETVEIPLSRIEPAVSTLAGDRGEFIEGQVEWNGKLIAILDAKKVIERTKV